MTGETIIQRILRTFLWVMAGLNIARCFSFWNESNYVGVFVCLFAVVVCSMLATYREEKNALVWAKAERLFQASKSAIENNGGPVDAKDTCNGQPYVLVHRKDFNKMIFGVGGLRKRSKQ